MVAFFKDTVGASDPEKEAGAVIDGEIAKAVGQILAQDIIDSLISKDEIEDGQ